MILPLFSKLCEIGQLVFDIATGQMEKGTAESLRTKKCSLLNLIGF